MKITIVSLLLFIVAPSFAMESVDFLVKPLLLENLTADFVLVNVWSPYCVPCGHEVTELNKLIHSSSLPNGRLQILGVPAEGREKEALAFIEHFRPEYKNIFLEAAFKKQLLKFGSIPFTILFNKNRTVQQTWKGTVRMEDILAALPKQ